MKPRIVLIFIFIMSAGIVSSQDISIELKYGYIAGRMRNLDQYKGFNDKYGSSKSDDALIKGISGKYFFNDKFYTGIHFEYYKTYTDFISGFSFEENNGLFSSITDRWSIERERITSSISLGHHFLYGFFAEIGGSYLNNINHKMTGYLDNGIDPWIDLEAKELGSSSSYGINFDIGFRYRKRGFYFIVDRKFLFEYPSSPGFKTNLKIAHLYHSLTLGLGYYFGSDKKEKIAVNHN